jgi:hypothetical protein
LKSRLKERLAKEIEQSRNKQLEGSAGVPDILSIKAGITSNTKAV